MNNTKHYTHPALGINVYKDNMGYFAQMEKEEKRKQSIKSTLLSIDLIMLAIIFLNPFSWMYIGIFFIYAQDHGVFNLFIEFYKTLLPVFAVLIGYMSLKYYLKKKYLT